MAFVISSPHVDKNAGERMEVFPAECIKEGKGMFLIDPDILIVAPVASVYPFEAIFMGEEVPEESENILN